jgi:hypothetical protein
MFGNADVHCALRRVEERAGFEQIEDGANRCHAERASGRLRSDSVAATPEICCCGQAKSGARS